MDTHWEGPQQSENINAAVMDSTHTHTHTGEGGVPKQSEDMNAAAINNSSVLPHLLCHTQWTMQNLSLQVFTVGLALGA